jgi:hypothetical protein
MMYPIDIDNLSEFFQHPTFKSLTETGVSLSSTLAEAYFEFDFTDAEFTSNDLTVD